MTHNGGSGVAWSVEIYAGENTPVDAVIDTTVRWTMVDESAYDISQSDAEWPNNRFGPWGKTRSMSYAG